MKVSIIIPTKNSGASLERLLMRINSQDVDFGYEVIVIDSGSTDNSVEIARTFSARVHSIPPEKFTHGGARNMGASLANGEFLVFCNQDIEPIGEHWLANLLSPFSYSNVAAAYSRQIAPLRAPAHEKMFLRDVYPPESRINTLGMLHQRGPLNMVLFSTVAGAVRKRVQSQNQFSEKIVMSEDQEFAVRVLLSGDVIAYVADSELYHYNDYSLITAFRRYFDSGWSMTEIPLLKVTSMPHSLSYLGAKMSAIGREPGISMKERWTAYCYLLAKSVGFGLGQFSPMMPSSLRSRISYTWSIIHGT